MTHADVTGGAAGDVWLKPLATAHLTMKEPVVLTGAPKGTTVIVELLSGRFDGRLAGTLRAGTAADWVVIGNDGTGFLDVRLIIDTDDGAALYAQCVGRVDVPAGAGRAVSTLAMTFETGDPRYSHFNKMVAVVRADSDENDLRYTILEVVAE